MWETPVPIPNTTVKTQAADGTMLETAWESRWVPEYLLKSLTRVFYIERTYLNGWRERRNLCSASGKDVLTYFSRVVLFHITGFYQ